MLLGMEPGCLVNQCANNNRAAAIPTLENVLILLMDVLKDFRRETEVLCHNGLGGVLDPLIQEESRVLGEVATVKHQQELGPVLTQTLERVWVTRREIPQITLLQVIDEGTTIGVEGCNADLACATLVANSGAIPSILLAHRTEHMPTRLLYANGAHESRLAPGAYSHLQSP
jgi:hypothetical protein